DYLVINESYPSRRFSIEKLAPMAIEPAILKAEGAQRIHFVTHSMGGILVRQYLKHNDLPNLGHVVMLGAPNQGSEVVNFFLNDPVRNYLFRRFIGPAGSQLGTFDDSVPNQLGEVDFPLAVIAGDRSFNPIYSRLMSGPSDGKVSISSTKVKGMRAHKIMPVNHTFMTANRALIAEIQHYLLHGEFASVSKAS
ncbi:MAG: alpha/beta hydrolase, partial [Pseudomonadota bacterium]